MTARLRLAGLATLAAATVGLLVVGGHALGPGRPADLDAWWTWSAAADPVTLTIAVLRLLVMAASTWIALTAVIHLLLADRRPPERPRWLDHLTPRVVRAAASASLSMAVLALPMRAGGDGDSHHQATMRPVDVDAPATSTTAPPPSTTTTAPAPPTPIAPPTTTEIEPPASTPAPAAHPVSSDDVYVVERSESLWSIASDTLGERLGRAPSDGEVEPFWHQLIAVNADRLVVPGNADLIYAGQELVLPA